MNKELIDNTDILALFDYGSVVYGTVSPQSDHDLIAVVKDTALPMNLSKEKLDVTVYKESQFKDMVAQHEISVLECLFLDTKHVHKNTLNIEFKLDKQTLRSSVSGKSSNSWVKAKKKFIIEEDYSPYIGKKSAWHAVRMLDFATQIAKDGKISNYSSTNLLFKEVLKCETWEEIDQNFRLIYNTKASEFRLVAPKEVKKIQP